MTDLRISAQSVLTVSMLSPLWPFCTTMRWPPWYLYPAWYPPGISFPEHTHSSNCPLTNSFKNLLGIKIQLEDLGIHCNEFRGYCCFLGKFALTIWVTQFSPGFKLQFLRKLGTSESDVAVKLQLEASLSHIIAHNFSLKDLSVRQNGLCTRNIAVKMPIFFRNLNQNWIYC